MFSQKVLHLLLHRIRTPEGISQYPHTQSSRHAAKTRQRVASASTRGDLDIPTSVVANGSGGVWRGMCWVGNTRRSGGMSIASESSLRVLFRESVTCSTGRLMLRVG